MASVPSTFPSISSAGAQPVVGPDGEPLFALVLDDLIGDDVMAHVLREAEGAGFEEAKPTGVGFAWVAEWHASEFMGLGPKA